MMRIILCLIVIALSSNIIRAQELEKMNPLLEYWRNEKLKFSNMEEYNEYKAKMKRELHENNQPAIQSIDELNSSVSQSSDVESEIHIAINPTDEKNILISPIKQSRSDNINNVTCPVYYSKDFGETWNKSEFLTAPLRDFYVISGGGDPMMTFDANGRAYLSWINLYLSGASYQKLDSIYAAMYWAYSDDGGESWVFEGRTIGKPARGKSGHQSQLDGAFLDKQWMATDLSDSEFRNTVYTSVTYFGNSAKIAIYYKRPDYEDFDGPVFIDTDFSPIVQFSSIDVDNEGVVHVTFFGIKGASNEVLFYTKSTDGGESFSKPTVITPLISRFNPLATLENLDGLNKERQYPCPHLSVDRENGFLYVTFTSQNYEKNAPDGLDIYFTRSTDGGINWDTPKIINDNDKSVKVHNFYSNMVVNEDGVIALAWYDDREGQDLVNKYMTYSFDYGETFLPNFKITSQQTSFSEIGLKNSGFGIGEYNELVATKDYVIPTWADGRRGDGNIDVYAAFVPVTDDIELLQNWMTTGVANRISPVNSTFNITNLAPQPADDVISFDLKIDDFSKVEIQIINLQGEVVFNSEDYIKSVQGLSSEINISHLPTGTYFLKITDGQRYATRKFIKR